MLCKQANSRFALWYFWNPPCQYFRFTVTWISRYRILGCEGLTLIRKYAVSPNLIVAIQLLNHVRLFATPMDCSIPGFPVLHHLTELAQIHVHWVGDAIQASHPVSSPSILPSIRVFSSESVICIRWPKLMLEFQLQHQSFQWTFRTDFQLKLINFKKKKRSSWLK